MVERWTILVGILALTLSGCGSGEDPAPNTSPEGTTSKKPADKANQANPTDVGMQDPVKPQPAPVQKPIVVLNTSFGDIKLELDIEKAPITVDNFNSYVKRGHYNETVFHYVDSKSMILGGGFTADLTPKETRADILNEANNGLKNLRGTIAMARDPSFVNSANCQFFINVVDNSALDYEETDNVESFGYCVFGRVIEGMEVVDKIAGLQTETNGEFVQLPTETALIQSAKILR